MCSTRRTPCTRNGWIGYVPGQCFPPHSFLMNPSAPMVRASSHALRHAPCMLMHAAAAIPPISQTDALCIQCGYCRAHTQAIWVAFGGVPGNSSWRDLPSGLLLAPLRTCQVHIFPPGGPRARHVCCPTAAICCGEGTGCVTAFGRVRGCGRRRAARGAHKPVLDFKEY